MDPVSALPYSVPTLHHIVDRYGHKSWSVPRGIRPFHNIMLIIEGGGTAWTGGEATPLQAGMLVYHPEYEEFGYETSSPYSLHAMGGNFSIVAILPCYDQPTCLNIPKLPLPTYSYPANFERLIRIFSDLALAWGNGTEYNPLLCRSLFMTLLDELRQVSTPSNRENKHHERIQHILNFMEKHYMRRLTLSSLAEMAGLTPSYFGQVFKEVTGETPLDYLSKIRIDQATLLMKQGTPIGTAAFETGFNNAFYFSRVFKKKKGISPSKYLAYIEQI